MLDEHTVCVHVLLWNLFYPCPHYVTNKLIYWGQRLRRGKGPRECVGGTYVRDNHQSSEEEIINSTYKCVMKREEDDGDDDEKEQQQVFDIFNQDVELEIVCLTKHLCSRGGGLGHACLLESKRTEEVCACCPGG